MFATLLGGLPRPPVPESATAEELVVAALAAQEAAGLEPLVDGGLWGSDDVGTAAERWRATTTMTDRVVKAVVEGPWSTTVRTASDADPEIFERELAATADAANAVLRDLAAAGCQLVEVHEPAATTIGADAAARAAFAAAQQRLLVGVDAIHPSLAITGGSADRAGIDTFLAAPYASLALDLVRGPDNWRLATAAPMQIGIVCGALTADATGDEAVEILLYALNYAASTGGRGSDRVGIGTAGSLDGVSWAVAERRMRRLGEAIRLAEAPPDERDAALDPRAISARSAALGRAENRPARRPTGASD